MDDRHHVVLARARALRLSRRAAVHRLGSGLAAAALALSGGRIAAEAVTGTPSATPEGVDLYAAVRRYQLAKGRSIDELVRRVESGFVPIVRSVPGFVEYILVVNDATGAQASVSIFRDQASAAESTSRASAWVAANVATFNEGPPEVTEGTIRVHAKASAGTPAA